MRFKPKRSEPLAPDVRALLERRAERLRTRPAPEGSPAQSFWTAEFPVGDRLYAIALGELLAVAPLDRVTPVPRSAAYVVGIFRRGGQILSVLSLASLLGVRGWRVDPRVLLVVDAGGGRSVALDSEQVPRASSLPGLAVEQARARAQGSGPEAGPVPVVEVLAPDREPVSLIDVGRLLLPVYEGRHGS